jgi:cytochrome P450
MLAVAIAAALVLVAVALFALTDLVGVACVVGALGLLSLVRPKKGLFPGPTQWGVLQCLPQTLWHMFPRRHLWYIEMKKKYGPVVDISYGAVNAIFVFSPEDAAIVQDRKVFPDRAPMGGIAAAFPLGLLGLPIGPMYNRHRRLLAPLMSDRMMSVYGVKLEPVIALLTDKLAQAATAGPVDVCGWMARLAFDAIGVCGFETDFGALLGNTEISAKFDRATKLMLQAITTLTFAPFAPQWQLRRSFEPFDATADQLRKSFDPNKSPETETRSMLSELLLAESKGELTVEETNAELRVMMLAGSETTGLTISWVLYLLAKNPRVQAKLSALAGDERKLYVKHIVSESMRLHPVAFGTSRDTAVPFKFHGVDLPIGTNVTIVFYAMNHDPAIWGDDVEEFLPERWSARSPSAAEWSPFGFGTRICVGFKFALLEAELAVDAIAKRFRMSMPADGSGEPAEKLFLTLNPVGLKIVFEEK